MGYSYEDLIKRLPPDDEMKAAQDADARQSGADRVADALYAAFTRTPFKEVDRGPGKADLLGKQRAGAFQQIQTGAALQDIGEDNDPNSMSAKLATDAAKQVGLQVPDGATYGQLKRVHPYIAQVVEKQKAERKIQADLAEESRKKAEEAARHVRNRGEAESDLTKRLSQSETNARILAGRKDSEKENDDTKELAKRVPEEVTGLSTKLKQLEGLLGDFNENNATPIPGQGPIEGRVKNIPLIGTWLESDKGKQVDQSAYGLTSTLLKMQSGSAVSEAEIRRKMIELGLVQDQGAKSFRRGLTNLKNELAATVKQKYSGFKPKVVQMYENRGGVSPQHIQSIGTGGSVKLRSPDDGLVYEVDSSEAEEALDKGWSRED